MQDIEGLKKLLKGAEGDVSAEQERVKSMKQVADKVEQELQALKAQLLYQKQMLEHEKGGQYSTSQKTGEYGTQNQQIATGQSQQFYQEASPQQNNFGGFS